MNKKWEEFKEGLEIGFETLIEIPRFFGFVITCFLPIVLIIIIILYLIDFWFFK